MKVPIRVGVNTSVFTMAVQAIAVSVMRDLYRKETTLPVTVS